MRIEFWASTVLAQVNVLHIVFVCAIWVLSDPELLRALENRMTLDNVCMEL